MVHTPTSYTTCTNRTNRASIINTPTTNTSTSISRARSDRNSELKASNNPSTSSNRPTSNTLYTHRAPSLPTLNVNSRGTLCFPPLLLKRAMTWCVCGPALLQLLY